MTNNAIKTFRRFIARWLYYFFIWLFRVTPYRVIKIISNGILVAGYTLLIRLRRNAMETLTIALGKEKSQAELKRICKECFYNFGSGLIEIGVFIARPHLIVEKVHFDGDSKKHLDAALREGNGVLGVSAHLGNFPLMLLYLAQKGYPINAVIRPSRDETVEEDFQEARSKLGLKTIHSYPRETCVSESIRCLRAQELLIMLMDQNTGSKSGTVVDFFGQKTGAPSGPVIFAMRTGCAILPIFTMRDREDTHKIIALPHFYLEKKSTDEETIQFNVQKLTSIIESQIRVDLKEWGWMHRRWKSRPKS